MSGMSSEAMRTGQQAKQAHRELGEQESEPALISAMFSFLFHLREVNTFGQKARKVRRLPFNYVGFIGSAFIMPTRSFRVRVDFIHLTCFKSTFQLLSYFCQKSDDELQHVLVILLTKYGESISRLVFQTYVKEISEL